MVLGYFSKKETQEEYHQSIRRKMEECERITLDKYSGLTVGKTIQIFNVPIELNGKPEFIHTTRSGDDQKEDLVLLHGFLVGLTSFYQMMADLSKHYRLWCIDLIGMGLSSRPEFTCTSTEETIDYFMESLEQWRKQVGLERFHLAGQSFGGYMSGMYALRYPQHVKKVMLITPAGVSRGDAAFDKEALLSGQGWLRRKILQRMFQVWEKKETPHDLASDLGFLKSWILKTFVKNAGFTGERYELAYTYIDGIFKLPESTLRSLHYILTIPRASGCYPLEDVMHKLKMPCEIYYGANDWMCTEGAYRVAARREFDGFIHLVPNAGHRMNFENPGQVSKLLINHKLVEETTSEETFGPKLLEAKTIKMLEADNAMDTLD